MAHIFRYNYLVPFFESDVNQEVKLPHLLSLALQVSGIQSASLDISDDYLFNEYGLVWVITDYDVTINRMPKFAEEIVIETEALWCNKLFCYRIFRIFDKEGHQIMDIMTTFVLIDFKTRKVQAVPQDLIEVYGAEFNKKIHRGPRYPKLADVEEQHYRVRYFDLDMNGHVNNSKYLEWILDSMDLDYLKTHKVDRMRVKYVKEVTYGSDIISRVEKKENETYHEITSDGTVHAQAMIEWSEK